MELFKDILYPSHYSSNSQCFTNFNYEIDSASVRGITYIKPSWWVREKDSLAYMLSYITAISFGPRSSLATAA